MNAHPYPWLQSDSSKIIYIGDPMCSWCYGFAPVVNKLMDENPSFDFHLVMGGLRPGGTDSMGELASFLEHHWKEVEARSGQPFNHGALKHPERVLDTEPGCRSVVAARSLDPALEWPFFKRVQQAFYVEDKDLNDTATFLELAEEFGFDAEEYLAVFEDESTRYATRSDFQLSAEMGIQGFPSVVIGFGGQLYLAANGYRSFEDMQLVIDKITASKTE